MKRKILSLALLAVTTMLTAQISPDSYQVIHSDSCWYFTLDYNTPKPKSNEGMVVVTHLCTPDTCISTANRYIQGRKYAKRYIKNNGNDIVRQKHGPSSYTIAVPEEVISDTVYAVTCCQYSDKDGIIYTSYDTVTIDMPQGPPMSCHRVQPVMSLADHIAQEHPHVRSMKHYSPIDATTAARTQSIVRYATNSDKLDLEYLQNAQTIDEMMNIINTILADSTTTLEAIQIVGYTSPDGTENGATGLGRARAAGMRDHIRRHHHLPDSLFEIADGGKNWSMIYEDIAAMDIRGGDSLVTVLKNEKSARKREAILKRYNDGALYRELTGKAFPAHRMACCTGIYYHNAPDSISIAINGIIDELINTPHPNYHKLIKELKMMGNDPRALNLQGVIEYNRHHRHAAKQAFAKAAAMGDEQAAINLNIMEHNKRKEQNPTFNNE